MRADADRNKALVALKRVAIATLNSGTWEELGYLAGNAEAVKEHPRLLRSLYFGDDDYESCAFDVLRKLAGPEFENLRVLEETLGLEGWLQANDPELYRQLYVSDGLRATQLETIANELDLHELHRHFRRIEDGLKRDPAQALVPPRSCSKRS